MDIHTKLEIRRCEAVAKRHGGYAAQAANEGDVQDARGWAKSAVHYRNHIAKIEAGLVTCTDCDRQVSKKDSVTAWSGLPPNAVSRIICKKCWYYGNDEASRIQRDMDEGEAWEREEGW